MQDFGLTGTELTRFIPQARTFIDSTDPKQQMEQDYLIGLWEFQNRTKHLITFEIWQW